MNLTNPQDTEISKHHVALEESKNFANKQGYLTIFLLFGIFVVWSIFAPIETTIAAGGKVITHSYNKSVKHTRGGIVTKIFVTEGDLVKKDQPLLELDSSDEKSQLNSNITKYDNNILAICRLTAEASIETTLNCEKEKEKLFKPENYEEYLKDKRMVFQSNVKNLQAKIHLLQSRNQVLRSQNEGLEQQILSNKELLLSYQKELKKWNKLLKDDAVDELKAIETQRRIVQVTLQLDSLLSKINENNATIESQKEEMEFTKEQFKNRAILKRTEFILDNKLTYQKILAYQARVKNLTLKAPSDGLITDMKIRSAGEVVSPQKQVMAIVPDTQDLRIEAFIQPTDIEKVYLNQETEISFPSFIDPSALPIKGKIVYVSADTVVLDGTHDSVYTIRIAFTDEGLKAIEKNGFKIVPGMPASIFIHTGTKTLATYLLNPILQMFKGIYHAN